MTGNRKALKMGMLTPGGPGAHFRAAYRDHRGPGAHSDLPPLAARGNLGSCLGSLNKGELITENVRLFKGHLSPGYRESSGPWQSHGGRTVDFRPQSLCTQKS